MELTESVPLLSSQLYTNVISSTASVSLAQGAHESFQARPRTPDTPVFAVFASPSSIDPFAAAVDITAALPRRAARAHGGGTLSLLASGLSCRGGPRDAVRARDDARKSRR